MIARYLPQDVAVVELGASIGGITNVIRRKLNDDIPLISVEANPHLIPLIKRSLIESKQLGKVEIIHAAIYYGEGSTATFEIDAVSTNSKVASSSFGTNIHHVPGSSRHR